MISFRVPSKINIIFFLITIIGISCGNSSNNDFNKIPNPNFNNIDSAIAAKIITQVKKDTGIYSYTSKLLDSLTYRNYISNAGMISYFYISSHSDGALSESVSSNLYNIFTNYHSTFKKMFFALNYYNDTSSIIGFKNFILFELTASFMEDDAKNKILKILDPNFEKLYIGCNKKELSTLKEFKQSIILDLDEAIKRMNQQP